MHYVCRHGWPVPQKEAHRQAVFCEGPFGWVAFGRYDVAAPVAVAGRGRPASLGPDPLAVVDFRQKRLQPESLVSRRGRRSSLPKGSRAALASSCLSALPP